MTSQYSTFHSSPKTVPNYTPSRKKEIFEINKSWRNWEHLGT